MFLARHGQGHRFTPSTINYRANIDALKRAGVTDVIAVSACGSFREELYPGLFVLVDQFEDRTFARQTSFFGAGCVAHVPMAHADLAAAARARRRRRRGRGDRLPRRRNLPLHGGAAILDAGRVARLQGARRSTSSA